jgi:antitoxin HicB
MVNLDPDSARPAPEVMNAIVRANQNYAGIYGAVTRVGRLAARAGNHPPRAHGHRFDARTYLSDTNRVRGAEFERRVQKLARRKDVTCHFVSDKGKGSHGRLYFGGEFTTLKDRKKEIGRDLLAKMCRDLNIDPHDLLRGKPMSAFAYPAKFTAGSDGRILVEFVDLPRVATDGKDDPEAMEEAMDALGSDLSIRLSRREEIPAPSAPVRGQRLVPVPLWLAPKLALYLAMRERQVNNSELARRLGVHERAIRRMLDPGHASKAKKIQAALTALGKQMTVEVRDAA